MSLQEVIDSTAQQEGMTMRELPIIMSGDSVRAILAGRKTQTRRVIKPFPDVQCIKLHQHGDEWLESWLEHGMPYCRGDVRMRHKPSYQVGDLLWVRETWCEIPYEYEHIAIPGGHITIPKFAYRADSDVDYTGIWRPSIHMPKKAARLFLRVTDVRAERVQKITAEDAKREGVCGLCYDEKTGEEKYDITFFKVLWDKLNAKRGFPWEANPWVWVYEFERVEK